MPYTDPLKARERRRRRYLKHRQQELEAKKQWRQENPEKVAAATAKRRTDEARAKQRAQHARAELRATRPPRPPPLSKEEKAARARDWRQRSPEYVLRRRAIDNASEAGRMARKKYRASERGRAVASLCRNTRRAKFRGAVVEKVKFAHWRAIVVAYDGCCAYCERSDRKLTQDHVLAISQGGPHARINLIPACVSCNSRKWKHDLETALTRMKVDLAAFWLRHAYAMERLVRRPLVR